jgi:transmembrane sensor
LDIHHDKEALLKRWIAGECTEAEEETILQWLGQETPDQEAVRLVEQWLGREVDTSYLDPEIRASLEAKLPLILSESEIHEIPVRRMNRGWVKYAAAIIIIFGIGSYWYISNQKEKPSVTQNDPAPVQNDVAPGGNKAMLTLADGSKIILDSAANGELAREGNAMIVKKGSGQIIYSIKKENLFPSPREGSGVGSKAYATNTLTTPRGGQYQLTLPDGSRVWLNAESSITYPTAFTGKERKVTITGEAYFEVASDKKKPFIVSVSPHDSRLTSADSRLTTHDEESAEKPLTIEVLGTHFNVNSYKEEPTINTTLIEGIVKLTALPTADSRLPNNNSNNKNAVHTSLTLKPGQQGQWNPGKENLSLAVHPDVEQVMAWKNGLFNFENMPLQKAMTELARWYNVEVIYEGTIPKVTFGGKIGRDLNLSQVLNGLSMMGVRYRIEGKKLIVTS